MNASLAKKVDAVLRRELIERGMKSFVGELSKQLDSTKSNNSKEESDRLAALDVRMNVPCSRKPPFRYEDGGRLQILAAVSSEDRIRILASRASRRIHASKPRPHFGLDAKTASELDRRMGIRVDRPAAIRCERGWQILGAIDADEKARIMARRAIGVK